MFGGLPTQTQDYSPQPVGARFYSVQPGFKRLQLVLFLFLAILLLGHLFLPVIRVRRVTVLTASVLRPVQ